MQLERQRVKNLNAKAPPRTGRLNNNVDQREMIPPLALLFDRMWLSPRMNAKMITRFKIRPFLRNYRKIGIRTRVAGCALSSLATELMTQLSAGRLNNRAYMYSSFFENL
jgi:hypothetical protein